MDLQKQINFMSKNEDKITSCGQNELFKINSGKLHRKRQTGEM